MIKTSGYRVSPSEIEETAFDDRSGQGRRRGGCARRRARPAHRARPRLGVSVDAVRRVAHGGLRASLPLSWCRTGSMCSPTLPRLAQREVRSGAACARRYTMTAETEVTGVAPPFAVSDGERRARDRRVPIERLAERVGSTPFFAYDRGLISARVADLRTALPDAVRMLVRRQGEPHAGRRASPQRPRRPSRCRLGRGDAHRSRHWP